MRTHTRAWGNIRACHASHNGTSWSGTETEPRLLKQIGAVSWQPLWHPKPARVITAAYYTNGSFVLCGAQSDDNGLERQDQAKRAAVEQRHCAETLVPARRLIIPGVDGQSHPANL